jgi:pimeloyl-ACP methyl ester carboxylesterase
MAVLPVRAFGTGAPVLVVHGVGLDAVHYTTLANEIAAFACALVPDRRGYGEATSLGAASFAEHVADLADTIDAIGVGPVVWVGVSGGATLGIGALIVDEDQRRIAAALLHEPLLGRLAPALHQQITAAFERLAADASADAVVDFMRQLVGSATWDLIAPTVVDDVRGRAPSLRAELAEFANVSFSQDQLRALRGRVIATSLGSASAPARDEVARILARDADAEVVVVPGGHFAPSDAPEAIAALVERLVGETRALATRTDQ